MEYRLFPICDKNDIGDEFHYLFIYDYFSDIRKTLLRPYYYNKPNIFKFKELLTNKKNKFSEEDQHINKTNTSYI